MLELKGLNNALLFQQRALSFFIRLIVAYPLQLIMSYTLQHTTNFVKWLAKIKDKKTRYRIEAWLTRVITGNFGDHKQLDSQLFEMRLFLVRVIAFITPLKVTP